MKRILCYGDSNTWGYDPINTLEDLKPSQRFSIEERWPMLLEKELGKDYQVLEEGLNGRTTVFNDPLKFGRNGAEYLEIAFRTHDPVDYIIIMLGTNDTKDIYNASAEFIARGLERIIRELKNYMRDSLSQNAEILIVSPLNILKNKNGNYNGSFSKVSEKKTKNFNKFYRKIARTHNCEFLDAAEHVNPSKEDGVHLNKEGHKKLAEVLADKIKKISK